MSLLVAASIFSYWIRFDAVSLTLEYLLPSAVFAIVGTYSLSLTGCYDSNNSAFSTRRVLSVTSGLTIAALLTASFLYLSKTGETYSRIWFVSTVVTSFILVLGIREVFRQVFHVSIGVKSITLIGGNKTADRVASTLQDSQSDMDSIRLLKHFRPPEDASSILEFLEMVVAFIEENQAETSGNTPRSEIWITADVFSNYSIADIEITLSNAAMTIVYLPEMPVLEGLDTSRFETIHGIPTLNSGFTKSHKINNVFKFLEDKIGAVFLIMLLSPLFLLLAVIIKLDSRGPVLYKQRRHGFAGREFEIFKFRTMTVCESADDFIQATKNDARITRVGKWLRKLSLDELPQLMNVLNGSMSLVGPRPHPLSLNQQYKESINKYMTRHAVKPGITGLAQVNGYRGETAELWMMENRIRYDLEYVRNWSLLLDIKILALTAIHLVTTDRAY